MSRVVLSFYQISVLWTTNRAARLFLINDSFFGCEIAEELEELEKAKDKTIARTCFQAAILLLLSNEKERLLLLLFCPWLVG